MKTNEEPKVLYLQPDSSHPAGKRYLNLNKVSDNDIEYIRTDAFIEKACSWLKNHYRDYMYNPTGKRLEAFFGGDMCNDFEDYMKGE